jgi:hypothetical protein
VARERLNAAANDPFHLAMTIVSRAILDDFPGFWRLTALPGHPAGKGTFSVTLRSLNEIFIADSTTRGTK